MILILQQFLFVHRQLCTQNLNIVIDVVNICFQWNVVCNVVLPIFRVHAISSPIFVRQTFVWRVSYSISTSQIHSVYRTQKSFFGVVHWAPNFIRKPEHIRTPNKIWYACSSLGSSSDEEGVEGLATSSTRFYYWRRILRPATSAQRRGWMRILLGRSKLQPKGCSVR